MGADKSGFLLLSLTKLLNVNGLHHLLAVGHRWFFESLT
jgi:hypothetical protein